MPINNIGSHITYFIEHRVFNISKKTLAQILKNRSVELINFALMPNHFHITTREIKENGNSNYMQRILNAYTKYFNAKYGRNGHLFQGPYKIVHVEDNEQLLYLSTYIHRNPREIKEWKNKEHKFPYSSYQDYVNKNRWGELLQQSIILEQIAFGKEYKDFTDSSSAKMIDEELGKELML